VKIELVVCRWSFEIESNDELQTLNYKLDFPMSLLEVKVPDIGDFKNVPVIEILVKAGDTVKADDPLISLESDKATMEVPAPSAGVVSEIVVNVGDKVSKGSVIVVLQTGAAGPKAGSAAAKAAQTAAAAPVSVAAPSPTTGVFAPVKGSATPPPKPSEYGGVHASPSVRRLARELDIDLLRLKGTGEKGRITKDDVKASMKGAGGAATSSGGISIPEIAAIDFSKFGTIETKPLPRIKKVSGPHLHRAWLNIPHVTHSDEADITELEDFRKRLDTKGKDKGYRVTMLSFLIKAAIGALKEYPMLNASLAPDKENLIYKKYYNIGVAVDTPDGLVVPVIKDADRKGILELSQELGMLSKKMRDGKFTPADISGGSFSISSLGGIGGTHFTPIVNAPEVAILGVVRSTMRPHWNGKTFEPRLMLPLCLSYDHRVVDGAMAARFTRHLAGILEDVRQLVL
jgi:pyruvate dehydrogenase E2 component (dihydrolipoamide acetyltransferase)